MKRNNKIILGFIVICLAVILSISIRMYYKNNGVGRNLGTFKKVILNEKYKDTQFFSLEAMGIIEETAETGIYTNIKGDTINKVMDILSDIKLKEYEGVKYNQQNFLNLKFIGADEAYLEVVIVDNKVMLIQTNASSDERFSEGYEIVNNNNDVIRKLEEILNDYIKLYKNSDT
ncbi:hypothetical protein [Clostridium sp. LIBA-8841]|uniref:hypothetical protein n=1 Tax=Clostridium sp. LIBA-8841 TaxID=2987530 RepID=UPI002AC6D5DE|nr:hypothetical protein [Clostridium sp. LIBA-8841]MDZ5253724.1 hypothetical protein [Clostridium sp. LIBA-8841]